MDKPMVYLTGFSMNKSNFGFFIPLGILLILSALYPTGIYEDPENLIYNLF